MRHFSKVQKATTIATMLFLSQNLWGNYCIQLSSAPLSQKDMLIRQVQNGTFHGLPLLRVEQRGDLAVVRAGDFPSYSQAMRYLGQAKAVRPDAFARRCEIDTNSIIYQANTNHYHTYQKTTRRHSPVPTPPEIENYVSEETYMRTHQGAPEPRLRHYNEEEPLRYPDAYRARRYERAPYSDLPPPYPQTRSAVPPKNLHEIEDPYAQNEAYGVSPLNKLAYDRDARMLEECQKCYAYQKKAPEAPATIRQPAHPAPSRQYHQNRQVVAPADQTERYRAPREYRYDNRYNGTHTHPTVETGYNDNNYVGYDGRYPQETRQQPTRNKPTDTKDFWLRQMSKELDSQALK